MADKKNVAPKQKNENTQKPKSWYHKDIPAALKQQKEYRKEKKRTKKENFLKEFKEKYG